MNLENSDVISSYGWLYCQRALFLWEILAFIKLYKPLKCLERFMKQIKSLLDIGTVSTLGSSYFTQYFTISSILNHCSILQFLVNILFLVFYNF